MIKLKLFTIKTEVINNLKVKAKELIIGNSQPVEEKTDLYDYHTDETTRSNDDVWGDFMKYKKYPFMITIFYILLVIHMLVGLIQYIVSILTLNAKILPHNAIYLFVCILLPAGIWVWSTAYEHWNYWFRKMASLTIIIINLLLITAQQIVRLSYLPVMSLMIRIPINASISEEMVVNLSRFILLFSSLAVVICIGYPLLNMMYDHDNKENILQFKVLRNLDVRKDKQFKYDFKIVQRMDTGKFHVVKEKDRTLHTFADGTTGTAKTSSVFTPSVANDMDQKVFNEDYQKKECLKELEEGNFRIIKPFTNKEFSINYIEPVLLEGEKNEKINKKRQDRYNYLKYVSASAGITVVAPNAAFADEVYEMASNRDLMVNRVDPILTEDGHQKPGFIGINPLYVSPLLKGVERDVAITNNANIFSDILQALYEMSGSGDAYFISLNNSVTIAICKLLMLTFPTLNNGKQPNAGDLQICINDFSRTQVYLDVLVSMYGNRGEPFSSNQDRVASDRATGDVNCGIWQDVYTLINEDLLGPNKENMTDRANGLRLQINKFINHPLIRRILCAEKSLDLDKALANGEIIIVNYALELGKSVSMGFGLFFLLSFSKACLRRPGNENSRILNINYIDELPVLLHPELEEFFSLFRQYKVANIVALQTLDQMEKSQMTKYLKGVLLGNCAHQIVFGRVSPTEMAVYEKMAGKTVDTVQQKSVSETSITHENPSYSYSSRESKQLVNLMDGSDIRYRDFQEVTFFTVDNGSPVPPFIGRVNFLPSARRKGTARVTTNWEKYFSSEIIQMIRDVNKTTVKPSQNANESLFKVTSIVRNGPLRDNKRYRFTARSVIAEEQVAVTKEQRVVQETQKIDRPEVSLMNVETTGNVTSIREEPEGEFKNDQSIQENIMVDVPEDIDISLNDLFMNEEVGLEAIYRKEEKF